VTDEKKGWQPDDMLRMVCNPVYAGIPPYDAIVEEGQWVKAGVKAIKEVGARRFLTTLLVELRASMEGATPPAPKSPLDQALDDALGPKDA